VNEPSELKAPKDLEQKQIEVSHNLSQFIKLQESLKKQKEISQQREESMEKVGDILQKIRDLDIKISSKKEKGYK